MSKKKKRLEEAPLPAGSPVPSLAEAGWPPWVWKAAVALIVVVLYWRALGYVYLVPGEVNRLLSDAKITGQDWAAAFSTARDWQPLAWLSLMADFALFGPKADAQRFVNLMLHLANSLLVFSVFRRFSREKTNSAIVAMLFALHPLRVEPVIWLIERRTLLATLFALLALRAYSEFVAGGERRTLWRTAVFVCTALAALSHPVGAVVPLLLLLADIWPLERTAPLAQRLLEKAELALIAVFTIVMSTRGAINQDVLWTNGVLDTPTRLANSSAGLGLALLRNVIPFPLDQYPSLDPPRWAIVIWVAALAAAVWTRSRPLIAGVLWFLAAAIPPLGLVHPEIASGRDSGTYLASIGLTAGVVWWLAAWNRDKMTALAVCAGLLWFSLAWIRVGEWSLGETLLRASTERGNHPLAHYELGRLLIQTNRFAEGEKHIRAAMAARPNYLDARMLLAGALAAGKRLGEAKSELEDVIRRAPAKPDGYFALGFLQTTAGDAAAGARNFTEAIQRGLPADQGAQAENAIGVYLMNQKQYAEALPHLENAKKLAPKYASAHANFGRTLVALGRCRQAIAYMDRARLYTNEDKEVVDAWTDAFNCNMAIEKKQAEDEARRKKK